MKQLAIFKNKGKGNYGGTNPVVKENILLLTENRLSQYVNDAGFLTVNDVVPTTTELTIASAVETADLTYYATATKFPAGNKFYSATPKTVVLDAADADLDRVDLIVANKPDTIGGIGYITVIKGVPSENPSPNNIDAERQYAIKWVLVRKVSDVGVQVIPIFDEGVEWAPTYYYGKQTPNIVTSEFISGSKSLQLLTGHTSPYTSSVDPIIFQTSTGSYSITSFSGISFKVKFPNGYTGINGFGIILFNQGIYQITSTKIIQDGTYGFVASSIEWQTITIPPADLPVAFLNVGANFEFFNGLLINTNSADECYLDLIQLTVTLGTSVIVDNGYTKTKLSEFINDTNFITQADVKVYDEGVLKTGAVKSLNFVGAGVQATNVGDVVTVTIAAGGVSSNLQKTVTANYAIIDTDNNYTIFFNSATPITITTNTLTTANFECDFYNLGVGAVTFVNGTATVGYPDGTVLEQNKVCALIKFMATTTYKLKGELV